MITTINEFKNNDKIVESSDYSDYSDDFTKIVKELFESNGFYNCGVFYTENSNNSVIRIIANTPLNLKYIWTDKYLNETFNKLEFIKEMNIIANNVNEICIPHKMKRIMLYIIDKEKIENFIK